MSKENKVDLDMIINWLAPGQVPVSLDDVSGVVIFGREKVGERSLCFASYIKEETGDNCIRQIEMSKTIGSSYYDAFCGLNNKVQNAVRAGLKANSKENSVK